MSRTTLSVIMGIIALFVCTTASAEIKASPEQVKAGCDRQGGTYYPQGRSGTYGCEFKDGNMVLCNKQEKCTPYVQSRTYKDDDRVINLLGLKAAAKAK